MIMLLTLFFACGDDEVATTATTTAKTENVEDAFDELFNS